MLLYVPLVVLLRKYESGYSERGYVQTARVQSRVVRTVHDVDDCLIVPVQVLHPMQTTVHACTADLFGLGVTDTVSVTVYQRYIIVRGDRAPYSRLNPRNLNSKVYLHHHHVGPSSRRR